MTTCNVKNDVNYWETNDLKPVIDNSLVLYLTPDYDGNYNDISGNLNNVINVNSQLEQVDSKGLFSYNVILTGNSYIKVLNSTSINSITTGITISVWLYKISHASYYGTLFGRRFGTGYDDLFILMYGSPSNGYPYYFGMRNVGGVSGRKSIDDLNKLINITVTYNGNNITMYLNGIIENVVQATGSIDNDITDIYIGCGDNGTGGLGEYTNAKLGNILLYSRGLTQSEVLKNIQSSPYYYLENNIL